MEQHAIYVEGNITHLKTNPLTKFYFVFYYYYWFFDGTQHIQNHSRGWVIPTAASNWKRNYMLVRITQPLFFSKCGMKRRNEENKKENWYDILELYIGQRTRELLLYTKTQLFCYYANKNYTTIYYYSQKHLILILVNSLQKCHTCLKIQILYVVPSIIFALYVIKNNQHPKKRSPLKILL